MYIYNISHQAAPMPNPADLPSGKKQSGKTQHVLNTKSCKINSHMKPYLKQSSKFTTKRSSYTKISKTNQKISSIFKNKENA